MVVRRDRASTDLQASVPIGRDDAAAVFARAAELDVEWSSIHGNPAGLDEQELIEIGAGAGLSPAAIRQAMAELHGGALVPAGQPGMPVLRPDDQTWIGPRGVVAQRVVEVAPRRARAAAERFLREQMFEVERDHRGRSTWRRRESVAAGAQRMMTRVFRRLDLDGVVAPVTLAVVEEPGSKGRRSLVRFEADLAPTRQWLGWSVGGGGTALAFAAGIPFEALFFLLAGLPAGGAAGAAATSVGKRKYRRQADGAATCLEAFLDRLEQGRA
jgi:hypothetical protein